MEKITIPASETEAVDQLTELGGLVTATEWERAAIVYAFTEVVDKPSLHRAARTSSMSVSEFAALGIAGLRSKDTVRRYHEAWANHPRTKKALKPGDSCRIPKDGWPPQERSERAAGATVPRIAKVLQDPESVVEVIEEMDLGDTIRLINVAQKVVDDAKVPEPVVDPGPLDTMVAIIDMRDAIRRLKAAEPAWSSGVRENVIGVEVAESHLGEIEIIHDLMRIAVDSESFERSVPR